MTDIKGNLSLFISLDPNDEYEVTVTENMGVLKYFVGSFKGRDLIQNTKD